MCPIESLVDCPKIKQKMDRPEVLDALSAHLDRKTRIRLRAVSKVHRDTVPRPKSFRGKLDTSPLAKVKMILRLGKLPHGILFQNPFDDLVEATVRYGYTVFTYEHMFNEFAWFRESARIRFTWDALKYNEYDSRFIFSGDSYMEHLLGPETIEKFRLLKETHHV